MFEEVLRRLEKIEEKLDKLEQRSLSIPSYPSQPSIDPLFGVTKCIKCGMEFRGPTGYVCNTYGCPTFLQTTC